jgi:hypothetical protein
MCCDAVLSDKDFPTFRRKFLLPFSEKKTEAASISETLVNFYKTARLRMPEGSELFVL